jgi:DNA-binding HxlR family transcriptional regulator
MKVIGEKWALLAVREIAAGRRRFDDIAFDTGAPRDILATRLKSLEAAGVIRRELYQEHPPRYEYLLSEAGEGLAGVLQVIREWGDRYVRDDPENVVVFQHSCGAGLQAKAVCASCGEEIEPGSLTLDREVRRSQVTPA